MSARVLSAFYDMEPLYKQDKNCNTLHINSMLDNKVVGAPLPTLGSGGSFTPRFFRRYSTSNVEAMSNFNQYSPGSSDSPKESRPSNNSCLTNKENRSGEAVVLQQKPGSHINSTRYKTELCRPFEENGSCKYGDKCQFAHGYHELRSLSRHPKYKTEPCRTFHTIGFCPYGPRCHFIHNADERRAAPAANANVQAGEARWVHGHREVQLGYGQRDRPKLHHSLSFSGFSTHHGLPPPLLDSPTSRTPPPTTAASSCTSASNFYREVFSPDSVSCINSAFSFPGQDLNALLAPLSVRPPSGYASHLSTSASYGCPHSPPADNRSHLQALRRLSQSPVFEPPPSPDSLSDRESYASGSLSSSGSLSGSESPSLDAGRRLPIFSRLSISDD